DPEILSLEMAVDERNLYWVDAASHIVSCPIEHCAASRPNAVVTTDDRKRSLRVDERGLYWLDYDAGADSVRFCPLTGCGSELRPQTLTPSFVAEYALDSDHVYWTILP